MQEKKKISIQFNNKRYSIDEISFDEEVQRRLGRHSGKVIAKNLKRLSSNSLANLSDYYSGSTSLRPSYPSNTLQPIADDDSIGSPLKLIEVEAKPQIKELSSLLPEFSNISSIKKAPDGLTRDHKSCSDNLAQLLERVHRQSLNRVEAEDEDPKNPFNNLVLELSEDISQERIPWAVIESYYGINNEKIAAPPPKAERKLEVVQKPQPERKLQPQKKQQPEKKPEPERKPRRIEPTIVKRPERRSIMPYLEQQEAIQSFTGSNFPPSTVSNDTEFTCRTKSEQTCKQSTRQEHQIQQSVDMPVNTIAEEDDKPEPKRKRSHQWSERKEKPTKRQKRYQSKARPSAKPKTKKTERIYDEQQQLRDQAVSMPEKQHQYIHRQPPQIQDSNVSLSSHFSVVPYNAQHRTHTRQVCKPLNYWSGQRYIRDRHQGTVKGIVRREKEESRNNKIIEQSVKKSNRSASNNKRSASKSSKKRPKRRQAKPRKQNIQQDMENIYKMLQITTNQQLEKQKDNTYRFILKPKEEFEMLSKNYHMIDVQLLDCKKNKVKMKVDNAEPFRFMGTVTAYSSPIYLYNSSDVKEAVIQLTVQF